MHLADARTTRLALISVLALLASAPLRLADQAQAFFPGDVIGNMGTIAMETTWGRAWWLQVSAAALGLIAFAGMRGPQRQAIRWRIIGLAALATATVPPLSGHAWGTEPRLLAVASDYFHVLAAGGWMGGLACLLLAALPGAGPREEGIPDRPSPVPAMVKLFSRMALLAVPVLVLTGGLNVWLHLDAVSELWTTMWGRSLLGKLVFVLAVMGLGLYNWRIGQPAVAESGHSGSDCQVCPVRAVLGDGRGGRNFVSGGAAMRASRRPPAIHRHAKIALACVVLNALQACGDGPGEPRNLPQTELPACDLPREYLVSSPVGRNGIPSLHNPELVNAEPSPQNSYLASDDRILGVFLDGRPLAVPHNILWYHEIANFDRGAERIAVTYCPPDRLAARL